MRRISMLVLLLVTFATSAAPAFAETITELDEDPQRYQERVVQVSGELVGDFGQREGSIWTQINDDAYASQAMREGGSLAGGNTGLAVAIPLALFEGALGTDAAPGGYRTRGPLVEITAVFHYHDTNRSGETWLEATDVVLVEPDRPLSEPRRLPLAFLGAILGVTGFLLHLRNRRPL